jgi:predicted AlkP superfamily pyrophosphatase or phosphodiesterase
MFSRIFDVIRIKAFIDIFIFILLVTLVRLSFGQENSRIPPGKPRLIIGIVIDQMRYDYIYRFWDKFEEGGFKRLIDEGTFCKNASYNYLFTQSAPGFATISTGTNPAHHGIVSTKWYIRLKDEIMYCTYDPDADPVGGSYEAGLNSSKNLLTTTLGDELKLSNNFKSKVIGIGIKDYAAILSAGHTADAAFWYDDKTGTWMTSSYYLDSLPDWLENFNDKQLPDIYLERKWNTILPIEEYIESLNDTSNYELGFNGQTFFPYDLSSISKINRNKRDFSILCSTPFGNTYTKDLALTTIIEEQLGADEYTDLLTVAFSATDYIGLRFGPNSVEIEDAFIRLDRDITHFLEFIEENFGKKNVLIYLTSDHGVSVVPKYLNDNKIPSGYFNYNQAISLLRSYLNVIYDQGQWVKTYNQQQIYLNQTLIEDSKISLDEIQTRTAQFMIQFTGIANSITASTLQTNNFTHGIFQKMQNGFFQKRSGDIILNMEPGWVEKDGNTTNHNSAYTYDTHVPLIWFGWKISRMSMSRSVDMTDIAPTIANFLNITAPNACTGKPILELIE